MSGLLERRKQRLQSSSAGSRLSDDIIDANVVVCSPASPAIPRGPVPDLSTLLSFSPCPASQPLDSQPDQDRLLQLFQTDLGFDGELPVSACVIYRALVHWRSFETAYTNVFDKILGIMSADIEAAPDAGASADSAAQPKAARSGAGEHEDAVGSIDKLAVLLNRQSCSLHYADVYLKEGLRELQQWTSAVSEEYAGGAWDQLQHIRQAVEFIVLPEKTEMPLEELCLHFPALNMRQLYRISSMIPTSDPNAIFATRAMLDAMREKCKEENPRNDICFLLEADWGIPFSVSDMYKEQPKISLNDLLVPPHFP
ncbi:unnamed protein product [Closterium sp. Yama58-4]|nr:unnamed protein product [Closterium sp. Yama58-4]